MKAGVTDRALDEFAQLAFSIGNDLKLSHKQLKYSKTCFGRVTDYTRKLLWNILSICASGKNNTLRALKELGDLRDSRALDLLHSRTQAITHEKTKDSMISAIGEIGHSSSLSVLNQLRERNGWRTPNVHRAALANIHFCYSCGKQIRRQSNYARSGTQLRKPEYAYCDICGEVID